MFDGLGRYKGYHGDFGRSYATRDPALTLDMYEDGDHLARQARRRYTEILFDRLAPLFQ